MGSLVGMVLLLNIMDLAVVQRAAIPATFESTKFLKGMILKRKSLVHKAEFRFFQLIEKQYFRLDWQQVGLRKCYETLRILLK